LTDPNQRKQNTERLLKQEGIPFLEWLPSVESEEEVELRSPWDVGIRIVCLFCVTGTAFERSDSAFKKYLKRYDLWSHLTPDETSFLKAWWPVRKNVIRFTWRSEALYFLLWSVQRVDNLSLPRKETDPKQIVSVLREWTNRHGHLLKAWPYVQRLKYWMLPTFSTGFIGPFATFGWQARNRRPDSSRASSKNGIMQ